MIRGIDYAWGKPGGKAIAAAGYKFVARYLSRGSKGLTKPEIIDLHAYNLKIAVVWETTTSRAGEGFDAGQVDAKKALDIANELEIPESTPLYFAIDYDTTFSKISAYFQGVASVLDVKRIGAYGGILPLKGLFDNKMIAYGWQTLAWSKGKWDPRAQLRQTDISTRYLNGVSIDLDEAHADDFGGF